MFNKRTLTPDDDPVHAEAANFAVAFSVQVAKAMRRVPFKDPSILARGGDRGIPTQRYLNTEQWRIFSSSSILFNGIRLDKRTINDHTKKIEGRNIRDLAVPSSIRRYLEELEVDTYERSRDNFIDGIKQLASWIITFAQVVDVESCAELPLCMTTG